MCKKVGVRGEYRKIKDEEVINEIKKSKVITYEELKKKLGNINVHSRLRRLVYEGKVKKVKLFKPSKLTKPFVKNISNKSLYYINDEDFVKWLRSKFPKKMSKNDKKCFTRILNDVGIKGDIDGSQN